MNTNETLSAAKPRTPSYTVRIKFGKLGALAYISHLDLMRTMTKLLVRARLPLAYSEGFNPIPRLTFSPPMSLGITSSCELLDVKLIGVAEEADLSAFAAAFAENLPPELPMYEMYLPESDLTDIAFASYVISFVSPTANAETAEGVKSILEREEIYIMKKTKRGMKEVNIAPLIRSAEVSLGEGRIDVACTLGAGSDSFLNPILLANHLAEVAGLSTGDPISEYYEINKLAMYGSDMSLFA